MKRIALVVGLVAAVLTGCVVQSFYPFCTEKSVIDPKPLLGEWKLQQWFDDEVSTNNIRPWVFGEDNKVRVFDKMNVDAYLSFRLFKLGDQLFLNAKADKLGECLVNSLWACSVHHVHVICKVGLTGDRLALTPLNYDWLKKQLKKGTVTLPYLGEPDDMVLFTAKPEQWEAFLTEHAANTNAFPSKPSFILVRPKSAH